MTPCWSTRRRISAPSILRMMMCVPPMPVTRVQHAPAVAVELRQRVQVHVAIVDAEVPAERRRVQPDVAVGQLHALRSGRRAAGVVDRRGGVLVGRPRLRLGVLAAARRVSAPITNGARTRPTASASSSSGSTISTRAPLCSTMYFTSSATSRKLIGHEHPTGPADAEQSGQQPSRVVADDRDPLADARCPSASSAGRLRPAPVRPSRRR